MNKTYVLPSRLDFNNPVSVYFGRNERKRLVASLSGKHCLVVTTIRGRSQFLKDEVLFNLLNSNQLTWFDSVTNNPDLHFLQKNIDTFATTHFDAIIAFGGGSVIDSAKVFSVALSNQFKSSDLKRLIKDASLLEGINPIPLYAVPTTSGTGSEVTPFATIWDNQTKKKYSLTGRAVFPHMAIVDPDLADSLPSEVTISGGVDAINQAIESIWNKNATSVTIDLATRALQLGLNALPKLLSEHGLRIDRDNMSECSLLAGLAISQTRTALCHSISYPLTAHFNVPHGLACGFTMPFVLRHNLPGDDGRFSFLARSLIGDFAEKSDLIVLFDNFHRILNIRERVATFIPSYEVLDKLIEEMVTPDRAGNNLVNIDIAGVRDIIAQAWGCKDL